MLDLYLVEIDAATTLSLATNNVAVMEMLMKRCRRPYIGLLPVTCAMILCNMGEFEAVSSASPVANRWDRFQPAYPEISSQAAAAGSL